MDTGTDDEFLQTQVGVGWEQVGLGWKGMSVLAGDETGSSVCLRLEEGPCDAQQGLCNRHWLPPNICSACHAPNATHCPAQLHPWAFEEAAKGKLQLTSRMNEGYDHRRGAGLGAWQLAGWVAW